MSETANEPLGSTVRSRRRPPGGPSLVQDPCLAEEMLAAQDRGHELALHGFYHVATHGSGPFWQRGVAQVVARGAAEFATLSEGEARARINAVVVTSEFTEHEFSGLKKVRSLRRIQLGVDLELFHPQPTPEHSGIKLAYAGRLSQEKNVGLAIAAVKELTHSGHDVHLDLYGTGAAQAELRRAAGDLPVTFHGHVADRPLLASHLAAADVVLAPCLVETFGLSVLEALACGTPVVAATGGASGELLGSAAGVVAAPTASGMARGVLEVLSRPERVRRAAARRQAERHPWSRSVEEMLDVHEDVVSACRRAVTV